MDAGHALTEPTAGKRNVGGAFNYRRFAALLVFGIVLALPLARTLRSQPVQPTPVRVNAGRQIQDYGHVLALYSSTADSDGKVESILKPWLAEGEAWLDRMARTGELTSAEGALVDDLRAKFKEINADPPRSVMDLGHATLGILSLQVGLDRLSRSLEGASR